jgi:hypothetical protein
MVPHFFFHTVFPSFFKDGDIGDGSQVWREAQAEERVVERRKVAM